MKIKRFVEDEDSSRYMFYKNLEQIKRQCEEMLELDDIDDILEDHDWASDHISTSKESIDQVYEFLMNGVEPEDDEDEDDEKEDEGEE